jgi:hypothetical protein
LSSDAKDFIVETMKKKGEERLEIKQMLKHPFITKYHDDVGIEPTMKELRQDAMELHIFS